MPRAHTCEPAYISVELEKYLAKKYENYLYVNKMNLLSFYGKNNAKKSFPQTDDSRIFFIKFLDLNTSICIQSNSVTNEHSVITNRFESQIGHFSTHKTTRL